MQPFALKELLQQAIKLAQSTGEAINEIYRQTAPLAIETKADQSPVTQADKLAHKLLVKGLKEIAPSFPIISEEAASIPFEKRKHWEYYWLIDPLDGTKEFIERTGEFAINIALIYKSQPVLGVVHAPLLNTCYFAAAKQGAWKQTGENNSTAIHTNQETNKAINVIVSRRHNAAKLEVRFPGLPIQIISRGSAIKICNVAEGEADIYPRFGETSEWDTAAGQCILEEAGGAVIDLTGQPLTYNKEILLNPPFLAVGNTQFGWLSKLFH